MNIPFTLVSTIFNESRRLAQTIADLEAQTISPAEIIITDAGSNDGSWDILQAWKKRSIIPIVLLQENRCNVARGRNLAIAAAKHELIVSTDFGCRFHPNWTQSIVSPFSDPLVQVVGGAYGVDEKTISTNAAKSNYVLTNGYEVDIHSWFIPSSRSIAYYKKVWEDVGRYSEWLTLAADDLVFGLKLRAKSYTWYISEDKQVLWLRHNKAEQYAKESFRYGLGDGEARVNVRNTIVIIAEQLLKFIFLTSAIIAIQSFLFALIGLLIGVLGFRSYYTVYMTWKRFKSEKYDIKIFIYSLYLFELNRYKYLKGYLQGYFSKRPEVIAGREDLYAILNKQ